jgi:hypothetical protein
MVGQTTRRVDRLCAQWLRHVQRWRLTLRRSESGADLSQRDLLECWATTLRAAGLASRTAGGAPASTALPGAAIHQEPKLVFAAPLPLRTTADRELVDLVVAERLTSADLRARLTPNLPPGHELVDLYDVWPGEPTLPGQVVAADYRVTIRAAAAEPPPDASGTVSPIAPLALDVAIAEVLAADVILRDRAGKPALNIRPLILAIGRDHSAAEAVILVRLRLDSSLGSGRPDDIVAAVSSAAGCRLEVVAQHRTRLWLRDQPMTGLDD